MTIHADAAWGDYFAAMILEIVQDSNQTMYINFTRLYRCDREASRL
ncbi:MAG: hypothetical protein F6K56_08355 [Moorea sp. SIO3G5]|nr:hypothetical protein [Moorena sp. SIO3G5]